MASNQEALAPELDGDLRGIKDGHNTRTPLNRLSTMTKLVSQDQRSVVATICDPGLRTGFVQDRQRCLMEFELDHQTVFCRDNTCRWQTQVIKPMGQPQCSQPRLSRIAKMFYESAMQINRLADVEDISVHVRDRVTPRACRHVYGGT